MKKYLASILIFTLVLLPSLVRSITLYDFYIQNVGYFPSVAERERDAEYCGIKNYSGTKEQNNKLLPCVISLYSYKDDAGNLEDPLGVSPVDKLSKTLRTDISAGTNVSTFDVDPLVTLQGRRLVFTDFGGERMFFRLGSGDNVTWGWCEGMIDNTSYYTLNGCTLGLNDYGASFATSTSNIKAHSAGEPFVITNQHHWYSYYLFDTKSTSTVYVSGTVRYGANEIILGQNNTLEKRFYFCDSTTTSTCGFLFAAPSSTSPGKQVLGFSEDGSTTFNFNTSSTINTAGKGTAINASEISWFPAATSTSGLGFVGSGASIVTSSANGISANADGINIVTSTSHQWMASTTFATGTTTIRQLTVVSSSVILGNIPYVFPLSQGAASTTLFNDGTGALRFGNESWREFIATSTPIATTSPFTISSIPASSDILILLEIPSQTASTMQFRFNGDTGANYSSRDFINNAQVFSNGLNRVQGEILANSPSSTGSYYEMRIKNTATSKKLVRTTGISESNGTFPTLVENVSMWNNTADLINSIRIFMGGSDTLGAGTRLRMFVSRD